MAEIWLHVVAASLASDVAGLVCWNQPGGGSGALWLPAPQPLSKKLGVSGAVLTG